ncbi:tail tape measure protein [Chromobacterium sp. ATCC 53434]|uniref:phage tail tape measure protein n=1 Tax=Chromobacterium sp. (strain ATCC 53434 / SC 14030) TaxID=2059672 RepID=UPI000C784A75|nr:phage tail tape measure protein [Chromobacterium sp. ATCC 53434]AUH51216.1 tail tape measure protein [Chromobacterium sp. ATCC 53434]
MDSLELKVRIAADPSAYEKALAQATSATGRNSDTIGRSLANVNRSLHGVGREATLQGSAIGRAMRQAGQAMAELGRGSYFGRLLGDLSKVRRESREAWRQLSTLEKTTERLRKAGGLAVGMAVGGYALSGPMKETMSYERRLAGMANTAFAERNLAGRQKGMGELDKAIRGAVRVGGGTIDGAAETLDNLLASGAVSQATAMKLLPTLQKYSTASGADSKELGNIAIRSLQSFGIKEDQMPLALDMAIKAGQEGGFELKDMSKWLPQQMAAGRSIGLSGMAGLGKLLALNQAAVITAGTKDEAGNNLVNLLQKINSQDTVHDAKKIGINLPKELAQARLKKGMDGVDAFAAIIDRLMQKDPVSKKIAARMQQAKAKGEDQDAVWESLQNLRQGSIVGKLVQDRQAMMALLALINNRKYVKDIEAKLPKAAGTGQTNYDLIAATPDFKADQLKNEKTMANQDAMSPLNKAFGDLVDKIIPYARTFPTLTTAADGAATAIQVLGTAVVGGGLLSFFTGGRGGKGGTPLPGGAGASAVEQAIARKPGLLEQLGVKPVAKAETLAGAKAAGWLAAIQTMIALLYTPQDEKDELHKGAQVRTDLEKRYGKGLVEAARNRYKPWYQLGSFDNEEEQWVRKYLMDQQQGKSNEAWLAGLKTPGPQLPVGGDNLAQVFGQNQQVTEALLNQVKQTKIGGTVDVVIHAPPGLQVETRTKPLGPTTTMNVGRTMQGAN